MPARSLEITFVVLGYGGNMSDISVGVGSGLQFPSSVKTTRFRLRRRSTRARSRRSRFAFASEIPNGEMTVVLLHQLYMPHRIASVSCP